MTRYKELFVRFLDYMYNNYTCVEGINFAFLFVDDENYHCMQEQLILEAVENDRMYLDILQKEYEYWVDILIDFQWG